jgi:hypothetical protein
MFSFVASLALVLALGAPAQVSTEPGQVQQPAADDQVTLVQGVDLDLTAPAELQTPADDPVPICILSYCKKEVRCDFDSVDPERQCCKYTCYADPSCEIVQHPPNLCGGKTPPGPPQFP